MLVPVDEQYCRQPRTVLRKGDIYVLKNWAGDHSYISLVKKVIRSISLVADMPSIHPGISLPFKGEQSTNSTIR